MRLSRYILEDSQWTEYKEPRSKTITLKEAVDFAVKRCTDAFNGTIIQRNVHGAYRDAYRFTDPMMGGARVSRNTANYYTLIIDNSPRWAKYPDRSRSLICAIGNRKGAFYVFPENGSRIGVCPYWDFWGGFYRVRSIVDLDSFNRTLENLACKTIGECGRFDGSLESIKTVFKKIDDEKMRNYTGFTEKTLRLYQDMEHIWMKPYIANQDKKLYEFVEETLDPDINDFEVVKAGAKLTGSKEVWTDGKSILVREPFLKDFLNEVFKRKVPKTGDYRKVPLG